MDQLRKILKLKIEDFGAKPDTDRKIRAYYGLAKDYMMRRGHFFAVHVTGHYDGG